MADIDFIMGNIGGGSFGGFGIGGGNLNTELVIKRLLERVQILEEQLEACLANQPLVFEVIGKCSVLDQRLKQWMKYVDGRLVEIINDRCASGSASATGRSASQRQPPANENQQEPNNGHEDEYNVTGSSATTCWMEEEVECGENESQEVDMDEHIWRKESKLDLGPVLMAVTPEEGGVNQATGNLRVQSDASSAAEASTPPTENKPYMCQLCPALLRPIFTEPEGLATHYINLHTILDYLQPTTTDHTNTTGFTVLELDEKPLAARTRRECHKVFNTAARMVEHKSSPTASSKRQHQINPLLGCVNGCERTFVGNRWRWRHVSTCPRLPQPTKHVKQATYSGNVCGKTKTLVNKRKLSDHKVGHQRISCSICGRPISKFNLKAHLLTHCGPHERPRHYCGVCGEGWLNMRALRTHQRLHCSLISLARTNTIRQ